MPQKLEQDFVIARFKLRHGDTYDYSKVAYVNKDSKVIIICKEHGAFLQTPCNHFKGKGCFRCHGNATKTIEEIESFLLERNLTLLSTTYKSAHSKLNFRCNTDGTLFESTWHNISQGEGCPLCAKRSRAKLNTKWDDTTIANSLLPILQKHIEYVSFSRGVSGYVNVDLRCLKHGGTGTFRLNHILRGVSYGCSECSRKNISGENSSKWNSALTDEERVLRRRFGAHESAVFWRNAVFKRDEHTCQICGCVGGTLNAHHLNGYHWSVHERFLVGNGVTLCSVCHNSFHKQYGYKNNTRQQFELFAHADVQFRLDKKWEVE